MRVTIINKSQGCAFLSVARVMDAPRFHPANTKLGAICVCICDVSSMHLCEAPVCETPVCEIPVCEPPLCVKHLCV